MKSNIETQKIVTFFKETSTVSEILTDEAINFLTELHSWFNPQRLVIRKEKQQALFDAGAPTFPAETKNIRK
jgi:malate synthase